MIIYSIIPQELIFQSDVQEEIKHQSITYDGIPLLVEMAEDNCYRVIRVLSSDPAHYLDQRCMPGSKISFS